MKKISHTVYLLLGSNLEKPIAQIKLAKKHLKKFGKIERESSLYQTAAWGTTAQPDFINQVVIFKTEHDAEKLMLLLLEIEAKMGRVRTLKNAPRIIDIDILFYDKLVHSSNDLIIPHPRIQDRRFVLIPLNELSSLFKHPLLGKSVHTLLKACKDKLDVKRI